MRRVVPAMTQRFINGSAAICSRKASGVFLTQQFYQRKQPLLGVVLFSVQTLTRSVDDGVQCLREIRLLCHLPGKSEGRGVKQPPTVRGTPIVRWFIVCLHHMRDGLDADDVLAVELHDRVIDDRKQAACSGTSATARSVRYAATRVAE